MTDPTADADQTDGYGGVYTPDTLDSYPLAATANSGGTSTSTSNAGPVSPSQATEVAFITGVNASGVIVATSFHTWNDDNPATYNTSSNAFKWGASSTAGTAGGTLDYYFDPAANWTPAEQIALRSGLSLWASVANVSFVETATSSAANLTFKRGSDGNAYESSSTFNHAPGTNHLSNPAAGSFISIDTSVAGFGPLGSYSQSGGYPIQVVTHEEGHFLGLGHGGAYNGNVNSATQQFSAFDSREWSIMSYIDPSDTSAEYYSSYTVSGTNWNGHQATTWMPLDILSIQQLYGVAVSTPLSGGQVFGFGTNITGDLQQYFDFTMNTSPVITLWDKGTGNTLNLSGYSTGSTVNLNAGTFSSFDSMTNNLAIAYNTLIDTTVGGSGDDNFTVNADADTIDGGGGTNTVVFSGARAAYTLSKSGATVVVTNTSTAIADMLSNIQTLMFSDQSVQTSSIACYVAGTSIETERGPVAVETLAIGDHVLTVSGVYRAIRWIGRRSYGGRFLTANPALQPVRFRAGSLGTDSQGGSLPRRDLLVSQRHAMFLDGVLIPATCLVNGQGIVQERTLRQVEYIHIELDRHDVLLAEGAASETFLDDSSRGAFQNAAEFATLYPDAPPAGRFCARLVEDGMTLERVRRRLVAVRAQAAA